MLACFDARLQTWGRVLGENLHLFLRDNGSRVIILMDDMNRRTRFFHPQSQDRFMHMASIHALSAKMRQKRRVDIEKGGRVFFNDKGGDLLHIAAQKDEIGLAF